MLPDDEEAQATEGVGGLPFGFCQGTDVVLAKAPRDVLEEFITVAQLNWGRSDDKEDWFQSWGSSNTRKAW